MSEAAGIADPSAVAARVHLALRARGWTLAVAESLTGGLVTATLVDVPGASQTLRGGVVAYATDLKASLLGVPADLLAAVGPVHRDTARSMARGVAERLGADVGVATTGVAGPDAQDGQPVGTVHVAVTVPDRVVDSAHRFDGDRAMIRRAAVGAALALLLTVLDGPCR